MLQSASNTGLLVSKYLPGRSLCTFVVEYGFIFYVVDATARSYRHAYSTACCNSTDL